MVVLTLGSVPLAIASHVATASGVPSLLFPLAFGAVGAVVARHQPRNPVGWLLLGVAVFFTINGVASCLLCSRLPAARGAAVGRLARGTAPTTWAPAIVCAGLSVMLFPDGRLPSTSAALAAWAAARGGRLSGSSARSRSRRARSSRTTSTSIPAATCCRSTTRTARGRGGESSRRVLSRCSARAGCCGSSGRCRATAGRAASGGCS